MKTLITPHTELPVSTEHTMAAWRCNEGSAASDFTDAGPGGYDLGQTGSPTLVAPLFGVNNGSTGARDFDGTSDYAALTGNSTSRAAFLEQMTFCALFKPGDVSGTQTIFDFAGSRVSETEANNHLFLVGLSGDEIRAGWETGAGVNVFHTTTTFNLVADETYALVVSRYATLTGTSGNWDMRIDLWNVETGAHLSEYLLDQTPPTGGTSAHWYLATESGPANTYHGALDEIHIVKFGDPYGFFARWYFGLVAGFDYDEEHLYSLNAYQTLLRVWVEDADGEMIDLTALKPEDSTSYVEGVEINRSISSASRTASVHLKREFESFSLAPDMEESLFNLDSGGAFGSQVHLRRRIQIAVATIPVGRTPNDWDFILHFDGITNDVAWPDETMVLLANDLSQELESTWIQTEKSYAGTPISSIDDSGAGGAYVIQFSENHNFSAGDSIEVNDTENYDGGTTVASVDSATQITTAATGGSLAAEAVGYVTSATLASAVIQQIIDDNDPADDTVYANFYKGGTPTLWDPDSLAWTLRYFVQTAMSVMDAITSLASQPGALLSFEFDSFQQAFRLKLREPDRSASWTSGDPQFDEGDLHGKPQDVSYKLADIRNKLTVNYFNLLGTPEPDGGYPSDTQTAVETGSIDSYGLRAAKISNAWNIDTTAEATNLASAAVSDMGQPPAHVSVAVFFRRHVEVNDFYRFDLSSRHFSSTKDLAVTTFTDTIGMGGFAICNLQLRGQPSGNPVAWRNRIEEIADRHRRPPLTAANPEIQALPEGLDIKWGAPVNPGKRDVDWYEVHVKENTAAAFTPSSSTLKSVVRGNRSVITGLDPNLEHSVHIVPRDRERNGGLKSTFKTATPTWTALSMPSFRAYRTTNQSLTGASTSKYQGSAEHYDTNGDYDHATNYRFTAPVAGVYLFTARIQLDFAGKANQLAQLEIQPGGGGSPLLEGKLTTVNDGNTNNDVIDCQLSGMIQLAANATAELWIGHSDNCTVQSNDSGWWSAALITQTS